MGRCRASTCPRHGHTASQVALLAMSSLLVSTCGGQPDSPDTGMQDAASGSAAPMNSAALLAACGEKVERSLGGGPAPCLTSTASVQLCGAPLTFVPTSHGFGLNVALVNGDPSALSARVRLAGTDAWGGPVASSPTAKDVAEWHFDGLLPGTRYEYEVRSSQVAAADPLYTGSVTTQRSPGESFTFALISDSHIGPDPSFTNQGDFCTLAKVGAQVAAATPDFVLSLGDMLDFHLFGFNAAPPDGSYTRRAYLNYRALLGDALGKAAHFPVIGNWDGEDGTYSDTQIGYSRSERLLYLSGPNPDSYPEGGGPASDYYAFTWGDALFVALNVVTYTTTPHLLSLDPGVPDDWTLGPDQMAWLTSTLATATSKWKFLFIHHAVGGKAGSDIESAYGRGGGQAAYVGEQAAVHALMLKYGVQIFFYGHDHVFTDMVVDGIHYSEPGSAGAIWLFSQDQTGYQESWLESGWGRVTVAPSSVEVQFLSSSGAPITGYTIGQAPVP
jgi:hypothetical protein